MLNAHQVAWGVPEPIRFADKVQKEICHHIPAQKGLTSRLKMMPARWADIRINACYISFGILAAALQTAYQHNDCAVC